MSRHRRFPKDYISPEEILKMSDDDTIYVSHTAICAKLALLQMLDSQDKEAIEILFKASNEVLEKEKKFKRVLWGTKMTVRDVKRAFKDLNKMRKTYFKKIA